MTFSKLTSTLAQPTSGIGLVLAVYAILVVGQVVTQYTA